MAFREGQAAIHLLAPAPSRRRSGPFLFLLGILGLLLAACGGRDAPNGRGTIPYQLAGPTCLRALAERQVAVEPWRKPGRGGCAVATPVRAAAGRLAAFAPAIETSCAMLVAWSDFEPELQRAAKAHLGRPVVAVEHYGSFACRRMSGNAGRLSLHAQARALDVAGFRLEDGRRVTVAEGWRGGRDERRFLRAVAKAACRHFSVTLTPETDRAHRDHLHVDIGPWRKCGL